MTPLCHIFIHSSVDGHLGCFHVLAVVNSAAMNIGVHVSFWITVFSGYVPSNRIAGSYRSSVFSFLRNLHTVLLSDCISLHSRQQCMKWKVKVKSLSRVRLFVTLWTVTYQAPPSMGFSRQEYWSGLPFPSPGDLPDPGIVLGSPGLQAVSRFNLWATNSAWGFPFLYTLSSIYCLMMAIMTGVRWYLIVALICISLIVMLSVFVGHLCAFFGSMSIQGFRPFFDWVVFLLLSCMSCLYILELFCQSLHLQMLIFSPILRVVFSSCLWFPFLCKSF